MQQFSSVMPPASPVDHRDSTATQGAARRYAPRVLLAMAASLGTLKLADVAVGRLVDTRQRHLLRLAPDAQVRHKSSEFDYVFRTNQLGLRGAAVPFEKPAGTFRIVVLGDSFVAGYGVADADLLTKRLQEKIATELAARQPAATKSHTRVEVVNVGRVGTSTIRELDIYEALGRRFQPDLVILAYYLGNDLAEILQEQTHAEMTGWHPRGRVRRAAYFAFPNLYLELAMLRQSRQQLREFTRRDESEIIADLEREARTRGRDPAAAVARYQSLSSEVRGKIASGMLAEERIINSCLDPDWLAKSLDPADDDFRRAWGRTQEHLELLQQSVARDGAKLVVLAIPAPFQLDRKSLDFHKSLGFDVRDDWLVESGSTRSPAHRPPRTAVALSEWARCNEVPFLDLTETFAARLRSRGKPLYFVEDMHWNPEGHDAAAAAICDFLFNRKLCP